MARNFRYFFLLTLLLVACLAGLSGCASLPYTSAAAETAALTSSNPANTASALQVANLVTPLPSQLKFESFPLGPDMKVESMIQDHQGYLWFGTENGLYRYDGYDFKAYRPDPQVSSRLAPATRLYEDRVGRMWVSAGGGLARFDPSAETWEWFSPSGSGSDGLSGAAISALAEDGQGNLWIATDGGGLSRLEESSGRFTHFVYRQGNPNSLSSDAVTALVVSHTGELWVGTRSGLLDRLDPLTGQYKHYDSSRYRPGGSADRTIYSLMEDPAGDFWLGVQGGLLGFDPQLESFTYFQHPGLAKNKDVPSSLALDSLGNFWIGTKGSGLYRFTPRTGAWANFHNEPNDAYSLSEDQIAGLLFDRSGILWIQLLSGHVDRFNPRDGFRIYQSARGNPNSLSQDAVSVILVDPQGSWWVGTQAGVLNRFEPGAGRWTHYQPEGAGQADSSQDSGIIALAADPAGGIWIGRAGGGLSRFDPGSGKWSSFTAVDAGGAAPVRANVQTLLTSSDGKIWIGSQDGQIIQMDPVTGSSLAYPIPLQISDSTDPNPQSRAVMSLAEDPKGRLWAGTRSGRLYTFDPRGEIWKRYPLTTGIEAGKPAPSVSALWAEESGLVWIGTSQNGIFRFDEATDAAAHYSTAEGLPDGSVSGILGDRQGKLWVSTAQGLSLFDPQSGRFQNFGVTDGLPGEIFTPGAAFRSPTGELFFGSAAGLLVFYPELVRANPFIPPVVITDFQLFYEPVPTGSSSVWRRIPGEEEIHLQYRQNVFTFEYAALDFSNPGQNQYAYLLEGFDKDWVEAGARRQASYTNLAPGEYTFRVKASNNAGVWNEKGASVRVVIQPPFWLTDWFRVLTVALAAVVVSGGVGLRVRAINSQKQQLQRQVEQRTAELKQALLELETSREAAERAAVLEERQRLARELHDSVTQLLYGQVLSADIGYKLLKKGDLDSLEETLVRLREVAGQSLKEMRLLLYELRPSSFEEEGLVNALELRLDAVERRSRIESYLEVKGNLDLPPQLAWEIYRIAIESLNNSLKHASATQVVVRLQALDGHVLLEVQDNGGGFDVDGAERGGFGISSMRQRAAGMGGRLEIESKPGQGSCVRLYAPLAAPSSPAASTL